MPSPLLNDPAYCRRRAAELRRLPEQVEERDLRVRLFGMGEEYERMALRAAVRVAAGILPPAGGNSPTEPDMPRKK